MKQTYNMIVTFDKNWIATSGLDLFYGKPLAEVMDRMLSIVDAEAGGYKLEVIFIPDGYRVVFNYVD